MFAKLKCAVAARVNSSKFIIWTGKNFARRNRRKYRYCHLSATGRQRRGGCRCVHATMERLKERSRRISSTRSPTTPPSSSGLFFSAAAQQQEDGVLLRATQARLCRTLSSVQPCSVFGLGGCRRTPTRYPAPAGRTGAARKCARSGG